MDAEQFDTLSRALTDAGSRRRVLASLLGATLGGLGLAEAEAKKKKGKGKKKQKKAKAPLPAPPPGPVALADASCIVTEPEDTELSSVVRIAQTFRALRTGQLTSASILVTHNAEVTDLNFEIRSVDQANAPQAFLAGGTIVDVPVVVGPAAWPVTATFPAGAAVVAGTRYALVIKIGDVDIGIGASFSNPCADGMAFSAASLNGPFTADPNADFHFATVVVA